MTGHVRVVLLAGPSGAGKSRIAKRSGACHVRLDDFYLDADHPGLPRSAYGIPDWDDPLTWDGAAALAALVDLTTSGRTELPRYDIAQSRRVGTRTKKLKKARVVVAEGIFAAELLGPARKAGLDVRGIWLQRPTTLTFALRLRRDLRAGRKKPSILVRRGLVLARAESGMARRVKAKGFRPLGFSATLTLLERLVDEPGRMVAEPR